jgi:histidyl-tRNA synthetase
LEKLMEGSAIGLEGVAELRQMDALLESAGLSSRVVRFDPAIVRGLAYYTGIVYEATLTFEITDEKGEKRQFGAVAGGGRYDGLLSRFTKERVPATGASIGIDRLLSALIAKGVAKNEPPAGPVLVTVMDKEALPEYQKMVAELRSSGIRSELYLGTSGFRAQMKYADKRRSPAIIVAGSDEFAAGTVSIKDMYLGTELAKGISSREEWREQPAQVTVARSDMAAEIKKILQRYEI